MIFKNALFLVVDDIEIMRTVIAGQLRAMGATRIVTAKDGAEALHILKTQRVDIILSDWNMPVMSGLELLKAIRNDERLSHLPFIMVTAEFERERIVEAIDTGVSDLLVKPFTAASLAVRVEKALLSPWRTRSPLRRVRAGLPSTPATRARPTLLVVDDTPENLELLSHLLKGEYRVRIANSGEKALEICLSNTPPDLVLLDVMMPGMDGFEVAKRMREHPSSNSIPVIFVTAMTGEAALHRGRELGAVDFITKPIHPDELQLRVRNFMRYVELRKRVQADYDGLLEVARLREDVEHITRHDMKGPLASAIGLVQAMADTARGEKMFEQLRVVEETLLQVLNTTNRSSELFKIETGRFMLNAQAVEIGEILRRITEIMRTNFTEKRLKFDIDTDVHAGSAMPRSLGDAMFCYSLSQNLILIACEAAPENSRVAIVLHDESPLRITIRNTGLVPADLRESFFDKYVSNGGRGESGLGAYSARMLTEAQNGHVALEVSEQENQTTITVVLPRYEPTMASVQPLLEGDENTPRGVLPS